MTGGAGFIGSHLCDALLDAGHDVRVLDDFSTGRRGHLDPAIRVVEGDVSDAGCVRRAASGVDAIFHLAAIASIARANEHWSATHRVNQTASIMVFEAARTASPSGRAVPVVFASSAAVYGDTEGALAREDREPKPLTAYGADKYGCELHAAVATRIHGVPTTGLRFFNVYGPRQNPASAYSGVISLFSDRIASGRSIALHGDGAQTRDFIHVLDVVAHLTASMDRLAAGGSPDIFPDIFNVCTGRPTSIRALAQMIASRCGATARFIEAPARPGDIRRSCGCPRRAARMLGLRAEILLDDGLARLIGRGAPRPARLAEPARHAAEGADRISRPPGAPGD